MKIAVIGGTGLIGSQVVKILNASGHEAVPHSPSTGVDLLSGQGLPEALKGADVVINLTNSPTFDDASPAFFQKTMDNLLTAAKDAGVGHAVILSIVGADLVPDLVYYRAKVLQEDILKAGPVPYSVVRATQFYEFMDAVLSWTADENTVRLPAHARPAHGLADVARAVADVSVGSPLQGTRNVAGPEVFPLDELGKITLAARGDHRTVVTDDSAGMFAAATGDAPIRASSTSTPWTVTGCWAMTRWPSIWPARSSRPALTSTARSALRCAWPRQRSLSAWWQPVAAMWNQRSPRESVHPAVSVSRCRPADDQS